MKRLLLLLALFIPANLLAQGARYDSIAIDANGKPVANASLRVCVEMGQSLSSGCTPLASIYSNKSLTTPITQPGATGDPNGNVTFYASPNYYRVEIGNGGGVKILPDQAVGVATTAGATVSAAGSAGADWCAKVSSADSSLGTAGGTIALTPSAGTGACAAAAVISSNHTLRIFGGPFTTSCSGITLTSVSHVTIAGEGGAALALPNSCADFSRPISILSSTDVTVRGLELNGNGNNQASGQQSHDIEVNDSNQIKILNNYIHDAQGDGVNVNTDSSLTTGCEDVLVSGNTFVNLGRQFFSVSGYGCNDVRVLSNYFNYGTLVTQSTAHGNAIHFEGDNAGTAFQRISILGNVIRNAAGEGISVTTQSGNPTVGLSVTDNIIGITNSGSALAGGIVVISVQDGSVTGNHVQASGATAGTVGILIQEASGVAAQSHRIVIANNSVEGTSSDCYQLANSASSGQGQGFEFHDNIGNSCGGLGVNILGGSGGISNLNIHDNTLTNINLDGIDAVSVVRFSIHHNIIRDFGLTGGATTYYGINASCNVSFVNLGPGTIDDNLISNATTTLKDAIGTGCSTATGIIVSKNSLTGNANPYNVVGSGFTLALDNNWGQGTPSCSISGWGTGASCSIVTGSGDLGGKVDVTAGTSPTANPTVTVTFGTAMPLVPKMTVSFDGTTSNGAAWPTCCAPLELLSSQSATAFTGTYIGTPTASPAQYGWEWTITGF